MVIWLVPADFGQVDWAMVRRLGPARAVWVNFGRLVWGRKCLFGRWLCELSVFVILALGLSRSGPGIALVTCQEEAVARTVDDARRTGWNGRTDSSGA